MPCVLDLGNVNVKFLDSVGNVTACHVSLTKEISCKFQIYEYMQEI